MPLVYTTTEGPDSNFVELSTPSQNIERPLLQDLARLVAALPQPSGLLLRTTILTSGTSAVFGHVAGATTCRVRGVGGGAAGGGSAAAAYSGGGCGAGGTYGERTFAIVQPTSLYTVGTGGLGVANADGGAGAASQWTHDGVTTSCPGGSNSTSRIAAGPGSADTGVGGSPGANATNADISIQGGRGGTLVRDALDPPQIRMFLGGGGDSQLGKGGITTQVAPGATTAIAERAGTGFGSGGSGRCNGSDTTAVAGANGADGVWIVEEYS